MVLISLKRHQKDIIKAIFAQMADPMVIMLLLPPAISAAGGIYTGEGKSRTLSLFCLLLSSTLVLCGPGSVRLRKLLLLCEMSIAQEQGYQRRTSWRFAAFNRAGQRYLGPPEAGDSVPADYRCILESAS